jgi:hypothetical protein
MQHFLCTNNLSTVFVILTKIMEIFERAVTPALKQVILHTNQVLIQPIILYHIRLKSTTYEQPNLIHISCIVISQKSGQVP